MDNYLSLESLPYGSYQITESKDTPLMENVKYNLTEFNKLYTQKVRLPDGNGNIIYLLSKTFQNSLNMLNNQNFIIPPSYHKVYYPPVVYDKFMGRTFRINLVKQRNERNKLISALDGKTLYASKMIPSRTTENILFITSDIYENMVPIMDKYTPKRIYSVFYSQFMGILKKLTPDPVKITATSGKRLLIIDVESFAFTLNDPLKLVKTNPIYMLYLSYMYNKTLTNLNIDIDILLCYRNLFIKFNPIKLTKNEWPMFKRSLFRIMNMDLDAYTDKLSASDKSSLSVTAADNIVDNVVRDIVDIYTQNVSASTKELVIGAIGDKVKRNIVDKAVISKTVANDQKAIAKELHQPLSNEDLFKSSLINPAAEKLFQNLNKYEPIATPISMLVDEDEMLNNSEYADDITNEDLEIAAQDEVNDVINNDTEITEEILDGIQDKVAPLNNIKTAPVNSARDKKLREAQKKIVVNNSTIEEILERDASNVLIEIDDKSNVMHTANEHMKHIKFANFEKSYLDKMYVKDIIACFDSLKDKNSPFYITGIDIKDSSNSMNYQETWSVHLVDETGKRHTIKVDIPKFQNDRFMLINGSRWIILKQNFYNPIVKDSPDTVIITTNLFKITINRKNTKSLDAVERVFSLIKKTGDTKMFVLGDSNHSNVTNSNYISSLEYDELSRRLFKFKHKSCELYFSRDYLERNILPDLEIDIPANKFYIGHEGFNPILIDEDTGLDNQGRSIIEIIEQNLPEEYVSILEKIKGPTTSMYAEGKLNGVMIPIIATLVVWVGLTKTLDKMDIKWNFYPNTKRITDEKFNMKYIKFADGILEYESKVYAELLLNGLSKMRPRDHTFAEFNTEESYTDYIYSQWGSYNGINELKNTYEFLVDPITKDTCKNLMLPTDADGLLIHAVKLLADNSYVSKSSDTSYRVRSIEMIPAILYSCIADQYRKYVQSGRRIPMTLNQRVIISRLIAEKTVEEYSTLNPVIEVSKTHTISTKGYRGSNSEHSYDEEKRSYDPSAVGKLAISTSADANVGINKNLVVEPTINNVRGYRDQVDDIETLKDVNVFSPVEMLTPGTARFDDPIRTAINIRLLLNRINCGDKVTKFELK